MNLIDRLLLFFYKPTLKKLLEYTEHENDLEWFQIIESVLGFHPVSKTDALKRGIEKIKTLKHERNKI